MTPYQDLNDLQRDVLWSVLRIDADGDQPTVDAVRDDVARERHADIGRTSVYGALENLAEDVLVQRRDETQPYTYPLTDIGERMLREQADRRAALVDLANADVDGRRSA